MTAQQPENNVVRVALQALAAVLGGTQSLHTNSMDEALGLPTEHAVRVALRTQQIIAHESGVADTADPLGGSYAIEHLTDEIEERALRYMQHIDELGGALAAVESGFIQQEIQESAYLAQKAIENGESIVIGVNDYTIDEKVPIDLLRVDPAIEQAQRQSLADLRLKRDPAQVEAHLERLTAAAQTQDNLMPHFIACVEAEVTLGEICGRLRRLWGEYQAPPAL